MDDEKLRMKLEAIIAKQNATLQRTRLHGLQRSYDFNQAFAIAEEAYDAGFTDKEEGG